jgi:ABC-2 type transport system ATP-binding protein
MTSTTNSSTSAAVSASGLRKAYKENVVLDGVDLTISEGEVFSLLGPNGRARPPSCGS